MATLILKRLLMAVPSLIGVVIVTFLLTRALPGDPAAYFAVPRYLEFMAELPMTENGKVQKYRLRERGVTAATWDGGPAGRAGA